MSKMLVKNTLRDISRTKARFISIMLIIMLGVGFLVGIHSTAPSMYAVADKYYEDTNLMDFRLLSTFGFTDEDVAEVKEVEGVEDVMPSYFMDVLSRGEQEEVVRLFALPQGYGDSDPINTLVVKEGRLPERDDEIVIGDSSFGSMAVGSKVSFISPAEGEELSESLKNTEFTVVGIVDSPMYISFERGATNVGNGEIATYMLISPDNFKIERYTELYVTGEGLSDFDPYSEEYEDACENLRSKLKKAGDSRVQVFSREEIDAAQSSLDEARVTYDKEKAKAEKELADAEKEISNGREELNSKTAEAEKTLADAKKKIDDGRTELSEKRAEYERQIALAEQEISKGKKALSDGQLQLNDGKAQMKESLFAAVGEFGITREQFDEYYGDRDMLTEEDAETLGGFAQLYKSTVDMQLFEAEKTVASIEEQAASLGVSPDTIPGYSAAIATSQELTAVSTALSDFLATGKETLLEGIRELNTAEKEIEDSKEKLSLAQQELAAQKAVAEAELSKAEKALDSAEKDYSAGVAELERTVTDTEKTLNDAESTLKEKRAEADEKFAEAERELNDAQEKLNSIASPQWYYYTREDNAGYSSYEDNVERVNAVGKVFPVFFLLVAVLVCVTTLSRLVEEQRSDIGALTTLGYKKRDIISKYVIYSVSATLIGAVVGIAVGVPVIPGVIYNAYGMIYSMPELILTLNVTSALVALVVAIACVSAVAVFTCNSLLKHKPATLLRPKSPKPGKRILLERIDFLWSRMGFFAKVTARNIFRYKARFFMTVIGVAGCTALIVAGLGLYDSINDIVDKQFGEIFTYDMIIAVNGDGDDSGTLSQALASDERIDTAAFCRQSAVTVKSENAKATDNTYIAVPENVEDYTKIVNLRNRESGERISMGNTGAVITEKLANTLSLKVGDTVTVTDDNREAEFTVTAICENYMNGYVFVSPEAYRDGFGTAPEYELFMCVGAEGAELTDDIAGKEYLDREDVLGVSFVSSSIETFEDMIQSLNYVVLVMIISAAALAFVVLYNLTNINIAERKREISTLKVLGFRNGETSAYIYRENLLLTLFGVIAGLFLGVWLLNYIIITVEIDMVMFGREIYPLTYLWSALLTMFFAAFVNVIMHLRIKKIDMVESLKSVE